MEKELNKQQKDSNDNSFYNPNEEETKLIELAKETKSKNSLYYGSKSSPS